MKKINIALFLLLAFYLDAQIISGTIYAKENQAPLPYVKIGVEKENLGVISDANGNFSFDISKADPAGKIRIEVAGYEGYTDTVYNFSKNSTQKIFLEEKVRNIREVKLKPKKLVEKNWGVTTKTKNVMYSVNPQFRQEDFLGETALEFNASKRSKIKNINLNIASYRSDKPVVMRYSIYNEKDGLPYKNILEEEITVELTEDMIHSGTFTLNVDPYNIWVQGKFFIGIQFLKEFEGKLNISAALFRTGFVRKFYGDWKKITLAAPAINIDVKVDKNGKNIKDETAVSDEGLDDLVPDLSKYKAESGKSVYGKNPAAGKILSLKDAEIYYETYGEGAPLVLLHGNSGSIQDFYQQIPVLSRYYQVIVVDTRGQGNSKDFSKNDFTYSGFADDLKALIDQLGLDKVNIAGWSDGGNTGLEFGLKYPSRLNKLIIIGANTRPDGVDERLVYHMKMELMALEAQNTSEKLNAIKLLKIMLTEPHISKNALRKIKSPALVIAGENDVIKKEHTSFIAKEIPGAQMKIYRNATHFVPFEVPDELNNDILEFLKN